MGKQVAPGCGQELETGHHLKYGIPMPLFLFSRGENLVEIQLIDNRADTLPHVACARPGR